MTQEEILAFLTRKRTQEELREYVNPDGKLNYFGTQKILNDYCNRWKLNECESYLYVLLLEEKMYILEKLKLFLKDFADIFLLIVTIMRNLKKYIMQKAYMRLFHLGMQINILDCYTKML